jgi:hypothetical protein
LYDNDYTPLRVASLPVKEELDVSGGTISRRELISEREWF